MESFCLRKLPTLVRVGTIGKGHFSHLHQLAQKFLPVSWFRTLLMLPVITNVRIRIYKPNRDWSLSFMSSPGNRVKSFGKNLG